MDTLKSKGGTVFIGRVGNVSLNILGIVFTVLSIESYVRP